MKDFFSHYGWIIVAGALITLTLMYTNPMTEAVGTQEMTMGDLLADKTMEMAGLKETTPIIDGTNITLSTDVNGNGKVDKGDTLTFATSYLYSGSNTGPTEFLVLNTNGSDVELLATENYQTSKFNTSSVTTTDDAGKTVQKYEGSTLDTLLNTTYYNSLSSTVQSKIKTKSITQNTWQVTTGTLDNPDATVTGLNSTTYKYKKTGVVGSYNRKVYALDVVDVKNYLGDTFTGAQVNKMFFGTEEGVSQYVWLRSAYYGSDNYAFYVFGYFGYLSRSGTYGNDNEARPAFTITLN